MSFDEMIKICEEFYDTIDFIKFIDSYSSKIEVKDLMDCLESFYDISYPELLPEEFQGCFFNFMDEWDFAEYLKKRYGYKIELEIIEKQWLILK